MFRGAHKVAARGAGTKMLGTRTWGRSNQSPYNCSKSFRLKVVSIETKSQFDRRVTYYKNYSFASVQIIIKVLVLL